jgi:hypothetical protein
LSLRDKQEITKQKYTDEMEKLEEQEKDVKDFCKIISMHSEQRNVYIAAHEGLTIRRDLFERINKYIS